MKYYFLLLAVLLLTAGCNKYENPEELNEIKGDYEWYYSYNITGNAQSFETSEDQHGIRIDDKGKVKFFTNGEREETFRISSTYTTPSGGVEVYFEKGDDEVLLFIKEDTLWTTYQPLVGYTNYYSKSI